ncbi:MAG: ABC transporter permease, partial [Eggerthellaceae bacterium]|nr:ABC transporter permease [Eggerthellaceae bacterium]
SAGSSVTFDGVECRIVARLDETGTSMDTAVFASNETVKYLISAAQLLGLGSHDAYDPEKVVSTVLVKVADGYSVSSVADDINLHVRGVTAVQTKAMTSGVADGIAGTSQLVGTLMVALWALAAILLAVAFSVLGRSRLREFAVLRVIGASRSALMRIVFTESAVIGVVGALVGIGAAVFVVFACNGALESMLGLPFLAPSVANLLLLAIAVFAITVLVASGASALSARRLARVDAGQILREE